MRIPSQLNQESLYRPKNQRGKSVESYRRIFRLCLGLVLVLLFMRQAARPTVYQTFFDPSQAENQNVDLPTSREKPAIEANNKNSDPTGSSWSLSAKISKVDREVAGKLTETLRQSDQQLWLKTLLDWQSGKTIESVPSSIAMIREELAKISVDSSDLPQKVISDSWFDALDTLSSGAADNLEHSNPEEAAEPSDPRFTTPLELESSSPSSKRSIRLAFLQSLDLAAKNRVVDGSVWRSGDFDSLYSFLHQAPSSPRQGVPRIGVLPLLQQPDVYRNQWVEISGEIARVDRIKTPSNPYGFNEYWQLWLRPLGGINRPIVAIVPTVPRSVRDLEATSEIAVAPELLITGRYLKRLSYQSAIGADLAPVIVGEIRSAPIDPTTEKTGSSESQTAPSFPLGWVLLAAMLGIAMSVGIMWNTASAARRSRELRQSQQKERLSEFTFIESEND